MAGIQQVSFTSPYTAEEQDIARRRQMAELLQAKGQEGLGPTEMVGGWAIQKSPWEGLGKAAQQISGAYQQKQLKAEEKALGERYQTDLARTLMQAQQAGTGSPAVPSTMYEDASGNAAPTDARAAVAPDRQAMSRILMGHPGTQQLGMAQMQKDMELAQRQQMMSSIMGGQGTPGQPQGPAQPGMPQSATQAQPITAAQAMQMIASGDAGLAAVGQAALKQFAIPASEQARIDQSDRHFTGVSGNTQAGLNQADRHWSNISPAQQLTSDTTRRGQNMVDTRSREAQAETARHHGAIEGDPTTIENTAQAIAKGTLAPLSGFALAKPMGQQIMSRVVAINPAFDPTQFGTRQRAEKDFATGKPGQSVRSFNVALAHLDTLDQLSDALNNGNLQAINKLGNMISTQTGNPAPVNFDAAKKIVADEIVKAIVGSGGGVTDREEASKTINRASSPAQLKGVINTYKELMKGQLGGLKQQYEQTTGKKDFDRFLSPAGIKQEGGTSDIRSQADAILGNR